MTDDIVERLRLQQCCVLEPKCVRCEKEDAVIAEIERLRELLDDLAGDHCPSHAAPVVGCSVCEWVRMNDE